MVYNKGIPTRRKGENMNLSTALENLAEQFQQGYPKARAIVGLYVLVNCSFFIGVALLAG
jgi:hypothetical protein